MGRGMIITTTITNIVETRVTDKMNTVTGIIITMLVIMNMVTTEVWGMCTKTTRTITLEMTPVRDQTTVAMDMEGMSTMVKGYMDTRDMEMHHMIHMVVGAAVIMILTTLWDAITTTIGTIMEAMTTASIMMHINNRLILKTIATRSATMKSIVVAEIQ